MKRQKVVGHRQYRVTFVVTWTSPQMYWSIVEQQDMSYVTSNLYQRWNKYQPLMCSRRMGPKRSPYNRVLPELRNGPISLCHLRHILYCRYVCRCFLVPVWMITAYPLVSLDTNAHWRGALTRHHSR